MGFEEIVDALKEWRDARQAIFDKVNLIEDPDKSCWTRLGNAEARLMKLARDLK